MSIENAKIAWADSIGRSMARADMQKVAHQEELARCATEAAEAVVKLGSLGQAALAFAKKNPGAAIGGGLGALHGLMNGGLGSAVTEGAVGAAAGHGVQHYGQQNNLKSSGDVLNHVNEKIEALKALRGGPSVNPNPVQPAVKLSFDKEAFGAALASAARSAIPAAMNFIKSNPLKAGIGAAQAVGNFASARKSGEGLGSSLLSGAAGAASAL